jgi:CRP/FNR family transcriptional regulator, cyclic AMP receptor protein
MVSQATLKDSSLFKGFTDTGLQILWGICTQRTFPKGTPLFVENQPAESLFIVGSGKVALTTQLSNGSEVSLGDMGQGDVLGELALLQQSKRLCTATAATEVEVVELKQADFHKLMGQKPQACAKLLMNLATGFGQKILENRDQFRGLLESTKR